MEPIAHPAPTLRYFLLDVFTAEPFSGNPLAVFVDPGPLSDGQMQRIAAELNLSETVFAWSPAHRGEPWHTRIFTPGIELPFAGHPIVGAGFLLANLGRVTGPGEAVVVDIEVPVGLVRVTVTTDGHGIPLSAELIVPRAPERTETASAEALAAALGLTPTDLHADLPVRGHSVGVPFSIVPTSDVGTLARARLDPSSWETAVARSQSPHLFVVTPVTGADRPLSRWRARMFAPAMGISEDPATGAAAAAFAGYLAELGRFVDGPVFIEQGIEMGRPSEIRLTISSPTGGGALVVSVGGAAVVVGTGTLAAPRPS